MEGSSSDRRVPEERVWIKVQPRYARILVPDVTKHYRELPKNLVVIEGDGTCKGLTPGNTRTQSLEEKAPGLKKDEGKQSPDTTPTETTTELEEGKEQQSPGYTTNESTTDEEPASPQEDETAVSTDTADTDLQEERMLTPHSPKKYNPPTTSKAPPPKPPAEIDGRGIEEGTKEEWPAQQEQPRSKRTTPLPGDGADGLTELETDRKRNRMERFTHHQEPTEDENITQVKEEELQKDQETTEHRWLTGLLPHLLDARTDGELRENMETILEQQPAWLRAQIRKDLRERSDSSGRPMTSSLANVILWRNYRLKITRVTRLFNVKGLRKVVDICINDMELDQIHGTG